MFSKGDLHGIERLEDHQDQEGLIERVEDAPGQRAPQRVAPDRKAQAHQEHCRSAGQKNTESDVDDVLHQGEKARRYARAWWSGRSQLFQTRPWSHPPLSEGSSGSGSGAATPLRALALRARDWNQRYRCSSSRYTGLKVAFQSPSRKM